MVLSKPFVNANAIEVIGVAPMAGRGTRLGLSISKELAPLGSDGTVLSEIMLQRMWEAGIRSAVLTIASTKQDIRAHYSNSYSPDIGSTETLTLSYANADDSPNTPTSIDAAYEFTRGKICALGFGDLLYRPCAGYRRALAMLARGRADVVLGLFPTDQAEAVDMVAFDSEGRVRDIHIKKLFGERFAYTWSLAVWQPSFTEFLHDWVGAAPAADTDTEAYVGDVFLAAMKAGFRVDAVPVSATESLDAGTPETLARAQNTPF